MIISEIINRIRRKFVPTEHEKTVARYYADGGDQKLRFNYNICETDIVLDLGGYKGQWASDLFSRYCCNIYVFEPVKKFATMIEERFYQNNRIRVFQYGLGKFTRNEEIGVCANTSSIYKKSSEKETIQIKDVKEWFNREKLENVQLMKINIEGGEYELLERLVETNLIEKIYNIQVQFHKISKDSSTRMKNIRSQLSNTHIPIYQYEFVWENWTLKK